VSDGRDTDQQFALELFAARFGYPPNELDIAATIVGSLGFDDVQVLALRMWLAETNGSEIPLEYDFEFLTVGDVCYWLSQARAE
jgi:hypothetical protein